MIENAWIKLVEENEALKTEIAEIVREKNIQFEESQDILTLRAIQIADLKKEIRKLHEDLARVTEKYNDLRRGIRAAVREDR